MRMRTIDQAAAYLKQTDPETALTKTAIRRVVISGELPSVRVGNKFLLSLESIEAFLQGNTTTVPAPTQGVIRPISLREAR